MSSVFRVIGGFSALLIRLCAAYIVTVSVLIITFLMIMTTAFLYLAIISERVVDIKGFIIFENSLS